MCIAVIDTDTRNKTMALSPKITRFLFNLQFPLHLPHEVEVMNPFSDEETRKVCSQFYNGFYGDDHPRACIVGINPGRFGGGITGIPFTDPIRLEKDCGIFSSWAKKPELSSVFIYEMMNAYGGVDKFYGDFYFTAVSPLGFTKNGRNLNYYDDKALTETIVPFAVECLHEQLGWGLNTEVAFCLGEGANFKFLNKLNEKYKFFGTIVPLAHPRFIMQYKLKKKEEYINLYLNAFRRFKH